MIARKPRHLWLSPKGAVALSVLVLVAVNLTIAGKLFGIEYSAHVYNNEASFMAIARAMKEHPSDLRWWPFWDGGFPFQNAYLPVLPFLVAIFSAVSGVTIPHSYHIVTAALFCASPPALYAASRVMSGRNRESFFAALAFSIVSPLAFAMRSVRHDMQGVLNLRRLYNLVFYGEGPLGCSLAFFSLAILFFYLLLKRPRLSVAVAAGVTGVLTALTNAFGAVLLLIAVLCLLATVQTSHFRRNAAVVLCTGFLALAIVLPLIPPGFLKAVWNNSPVSGGDYKFNGRSAAGVCILAAAVAVIWFSTRRTLSPFMRFVLLYSCATAGIAGLGVLRMAVVPQPHRYQLPADMALCVLGVFTAFAIVDRIPPKARIVLYGAGLVAIAGQTIHVARWAGNLIQPVEIERTPSFKIANWLQTHMPQQRVMISASHAYLANLIADVFQLAGGHEPSVTNFQAVQASHFVYTASAPVSILWMKSFGVRAVTVPGAGSSEYFKPFGDPGKFDGLLPVLWRENDDTIYGLPSKSNSLAHAISRADLIPSGFNSESNPAPMSRFVSAMETAPPAEMRWINRHELGIAARIGAGDVVSVQISYDPGWHATVSGAPRAIQPDGLGLMAIEPACLGDCEIHLVFDGGAELRGTRIVSASALTVTAALIVIRLRRRRR